MQVGYNYDLVEMSKETKLAQKLNQMGVTVNAKYLGIQKPKWDDKNFHDTYEVKLGRMGKTETFPFFESLANTEKGKLIELDGVLHCVFSDASYGEYDFEEFCENLGYDLVIDRKRAFEAYQACSKVSYFINSNFDEEEVQELYDIINE